MIIGSNTTSAETWLSSIMSKKAAIPLKKANLSVNDKEVLATLGLSPGQWNNLNVLLALYNKTGKYDVFSFRDSNLGELSCKNILEEIERLLQNSTKMTHGGKLAISWLGLRVD